MGRFLRLWIIANLPFFCFFVFTVNFTSTVREIKHVGKLPKVSNTWIFCQWSFYFFIYFWFSNSLLFPLLPDPYGRTGENAPKKKNSGHAKIFDYKNCRNFSLPLYAAKFSKKTTKWSYLENWAWASELSLNYAKMDSMSRNFWKFEIRLCTQKLLLYNNHKTYRKMFFFTDRKSVV